MYIFKKRKNKHLISVYPVSMHPILTRINRGGYKGWYINTFSLYKRISLQEKRPGRVISTHNSFSYENISIKFSMHHTKSIKV